MPDPSQVVDSHIGIYIGLATQLIVFVFSAGMAWNELKNLAQRLARIEAKIDKQNHGP